MGDSECFLRGSKSYDRQLPRLPLCPPLRCSLASKASTGSPDHSHEPQSYTNHIRQSQRTANSAPQSPAPTCPALPSTCPPLSRSSRESSPSWSPTSSNTASSTSSPHRLSSGSRRYDVLQSETKSHQRDPSLTLATSPSTTMSSAASATAVCPLSTPPSCSSDATSLRRSTSTLPLLAG
jgi:hypothetical protein